MDGESTRSGDDRLVRASADRIYGGGRRIWDQGDGWNVYKRSAIDDFANRIAIPFLERAERVLDAGCGCEPYTWTPQRALSLDRFDRQVEHRSNAVVGDLTSLPLASGCMDFVICVASVLNYVSAPEALSELSRVTRGGGHLLLHFETSTSFEHLGRRTWRRSVSRIRTVNNGEDDTIWVYRPDFVFALLRSFGYDVVATTRFHILSSLGLRLGMSQNRAAVFSRLDAVARPLSSFADDVILLAEKRV